VYIKIHSHKDPFSIPVTQKAERKEISRKTEQESKKTE
jgi:hypothetical protein